MAVLPLRVELIEQRRPVVLASASHGNGRTLRSVVDGAALTGGVEPEGLPLARLLERGAGHLRAAAEAQRVQSEAAAQQARALAGFAAARPASVLDRADPEVGAAAASSRAARPAALTAVSEWAVDEVMVGLSLSAPAAAALLADSITLVQQLPATLAALEVGDLSWAHARMLCEVLAPIAEDTVRGQVEARVLARAGGKNVSALRVAAKRAVLRADASAAARRLAAAVRDRSVRVHPGEDGMASLTATLPVPVARACYRMLEAYALECATPGDGRTKDQRMVDCLVDLLLRPDADGRPPVRAQLTVVAGVGTLTGGDEPGEVDGQPVPAELVRALATALGLLPPTPPDNHAATHPDTDPDTAADTDTDADTAAGTDPADSDSDATETDTETSTETSTEGSTGTGTGGQGSALADLLNLRSVAGTGLAELPRIAVIDELSGQLRALTFPTEIRRTATTGQSLRPPPPTAGYQPSAALQRFV
ncbi:protein of unknown function, partial [Blastococcus haudaquaticus]